MQDYFHNRYQLDCAYNLYWSTSHTDMATMQFLKDYFRANNGTKRDG